MQAGDLFSSDIQAVTSRVLVNGVQREVLSWSMNSELTGDLPEQVVSAGSVSGITGDIEWASSDVNTGELNPWNPSSGWIPAKGDRVEVFAGDGVSEWRRFVGVIDSTNGTIGGGLSSQVIDRRDNFSAPVQLPALLAVMPPRLWDGPYRRIGLTPRFYVDAAFRRAGFFVTPMRMPNTALDVPLQGSAWPLVGRVDVCERISLPKQSPRRYEGSFCSMGDFHAEYLATHERVASDAVQLTIMRAEGHQGLGRVRMHHGSQVLELRATVGGAALLLGSSVICTIASAGEPIFQAVVRDGVATLRSSSGAISTGATTFGGPSLLSHVEIHADEKARIAGVQISYPASPIEEFTGINFKPSAHIRPGNLTGIIPVGPALETVSGRQLLDEITSSIYWAVWIDEEGMAQCAASDVLREQPVVNTVTTLDDIRELSWEQSILHVRSTVHATYTGSAISRRRDHTVTVWEATQTVVLKAEEVHEEIIDPGPDTLWFMVDYTLGDPAVVINFSALNKGSGSLGGGIYTDGVNEEWASTARLSCTLTEKGASQWLFRAEGLNIPETHQVELRTVSTEFVGTTGLWPAWWGVNTPLIRAKAKAELSDREIPAVTAGALGKDLEIHTGLWATGNTDETETTAVQGIAEFIASQVSAPQPTISDLRVGFDPRRQLGDVIRVYSPQFLGIDLKCLVTGVAESMTSQGVSQSLSVRVISASTTYTTYAEFAAAWGEKSSYDDFATAWGVVSTYDDFNNDPLRGT